MKFVVCLLVALLLPLAALAADPAPLQSFPPAKLTSVLGRPTGGACKVDSDCITGCVKDSKAITCIAKTEGSAQCMDGRFVIAASESCGCLSDVKTCGYINTNAVHH